MPASPPTSTGETVSVAEHDADCKVRVASRQDSGLLHCHFCDRFYPPQGAPMIETTTPVANGTITVAYAVEEKAAPINLSIESKIGDAWLTPDQAVTLAYDLLAKTAYAAPVPLWAVVVDVYGGAVVPMELNEFLDDPEQPIGNLISVFRDQVTAGQVAEMIEKRAKD